MVIFRTEFTINVVLYQSKRLDHPKRMESTLSFPLLLSRGVEDLLQALIKSSLNDLVQESSTARRPCDCQTDLN